MRSYREVLPEGLRRERVDKVLGERLEGVSRETIKRWIGEGRVLVDGQACRPRDLVGPGTLVEVEPGPRPPTTAEPDASVHFEVLFDDPHLVVVNKPAGLVVHPGRGHASGTLVNGLLALPGFERTTADPRDPEGHLRPGVVHRIDRDTSGILVVARSEAAREGLKAQLGAHTVERLYQAVTIGVPRVQRIESLHGRDPKSRIRFTTEVREGKRAVTHVRVVRTLAQGQAALVECRLETGRTHQIRVHLSEIAKAPLLADALYGGNKGPPDVLAVAKELGRQALHARVLGFVHPITGEPLRFEAPLPTDLERAIERLGA